MGQSPIDRRSFLLGTLGAGAVCGCRFSAEDRARPGVAGRPTADVDIDPDTLVGRPGHYRVGRTQAGTWWMLRPDGKPFVYRGVCALWVRPPGTEALAYRRFWESLHGEDLDRFTGHCFGILDDLGFNALGEWATEEFWNRGWPFTVLIHVRQVRKQSNLTPKLPDVFDPAWRKAYDEACRKTCSRLRDSTDLVGYFVDNEGGWYQARRDYVWGYDKGPMVDKDVLGKSPLLLQMFLGADPKHPGHAYAWDWVRKRHGGSVAQVAADWGAEFDSPAGLRDSHEKGLALASRAFKADQDAFTTHLVREYFRITSEAIRRYDPNHLLLGGRYGGPPGDVVMQACDRRHLDVVSFNNYRPNFRERADEYWKHTEMPMLNGEFSWASGGFLDWNKLEAGRTFSADEKAVCRRRGIVALEGAFTHPGLIGYTWYKFCTDFPDPDGPHWGVINPRGRPNRFNGDILRHVNPRLEAIHAGLLQPTEAAMP